MWPRVRTLALLLSLSLNAAFLAIGVGHAVTGDRFRASGPSQDRTPGTIWCPIHRELGVSPEQWKQIEPRLVQFQDAAQKQREVIQELRTQMMARLAAPEVAAEAVKAKQEEILAAQRVMQGLVIEYLLAERELLTPPQRARLFELIREHCGAAEGPGPMLAPFEGDRRD